MNHEQLTSSFVLPCGVELKNRIVKAALTERIAGSDHLPNHKHETVYEHWAENGAGLLLTGNILVDRRYLESTGNVVIEKETEEAAFRSWTEKVTANNCEFWAQLSHAGRQSSRFSTRNPVSASDVQLKKMGLFAKPRALDKNGIEDVIERFVFAAEFCKRVGFTGVQFHAAHGYLISQFLSPRTNLRTDEWGGTIENRARILTTIIEEARKRLGPHFPISVKLNSADFQKGGFDNRDATFVIKELEKRGIDLIEISGGTYERSAMMGVGMKETTLQREAYFLDFAKEVRAFTKVPLMVTGGFRSKDFCEDSIAKGHLDLVGLGRPFVIEEDFPQSFFKEENHSVAAPEISVLDKKNADAAEAGYYDLQIKRLAAGKSLKSSYSGLRIAAHIPTLEMRMGLRNLIFRR